MAHFLRHAVYHLSLISEVPHRDLLNAPYHDAVGGVNRSRVESSRFHACDDARDSTCLV